MDINKLIGQIIHADCYDILKELPDKSVDLILTDPPYGIGECQGQYKSRNSNRIDRRNGRPIIINHPGYKINDWDLKPPSAEVFAEMLRTSQNQIVWGGNFFNFPPSPCWLVWDKVNGDSDFADCELAWTSFDSAVRLLAYMWSGFCQGKSIVEGRINQGNKRLCERRVHPTQKPVPLFKWCLMNYSKEDDLILDPFAGSGTTALACHALNRRFICIEKEAEYVEVARNRLEIAKSQLDLFRDGAKTCCGGAESNNQQLKADI